MFAPQIVTTYIPLLMDTASRNHRLAQYGFQCNCHACQTRASDAQRVQAGGTLRELEQSMDDDELEDRAPRHESRHRYNYNHNYAQAEALASYVEKEGFADYLVPTSRLASHYAAQAHNVSSAQRWAKKHLQYHEVVDRDSIGSRMARELLASLS